jgi:hypothetical protein
LNAVIASSPAARCEPLIHPAAISVDAALTNGVRSTAERPKSSKSPRIGVANMKQERSYFMRRAAQERSAADHASGKAARSAHLELERHYRDLVGRPKKPEPGDRTAA